MNRKLTPSAWYLGSFPETAGARYSPVASQDVAIQNIAS